MKRRGFLQPLPRAHRPRPSAPRLGGPSRILESPPPPVDEDGESTTIWRDEACDNLPDASIIEEDVEPPAEFDRALQPLSTNLLGMNFGSDRIDEEVDEEVDGLGGDEDIDRHKSRATIGGELLPAEDAEISLAGHERDNATDEGTTQGNVLEMEDIENAATSSTEPMEQQTQSRPEFQHQSPITPENILDEVIFDGPNHKYLDTLGNDFHLAMMLFVTSADISTTQYEALTEVLALATQTSLQSLPKSIKTLRERCRKSFPIMHMKSRLVQVDLSSKPPKKETPRNAYYFDPSEYCRIWLSNPSMRANIHQGLGEFVSVASELWHGDAWMESVRSTSGKFAYINESVLLSGDSMELVPAVNRVELLPSDCVRFRDHNGSIVLGRVKCVGVDRRDSLGIRTRECALINRLMYPCHLPVPWLNLWAKLNESRRQDQDQDQRPPLKEDVRNNYCLGNSQLPELVLIETREIIPCSAIISRVWVHFTDYASAEQLKPSLLPYPPTHCVRSIAYTYNGEYAMRSVFKRHRVLAELELEQLTREYVLSSLVSHHCQSSAAPAPHDQQLRRISVPYSVFLDGFGLYRNCYYSLKGMYLTPAGIDIGERTRLYNMYVLMIGPFGCNEAQMASCLKMDALSVGRGCSMTLDSGEEVFVTAFPLQLTGDMPQQNQNSGAKTHKAEFGCRSCFIPDSMWKELGFNTIDCGRYLQHVLYLRKHAAALTTKAAQAKAYQQQGLNPAGPYFGGCYTMMDPQRGTPNDPMHAEIRLCKYFSEALLEGILSTDGIKAYRAAWSVIQVPYRWGQPQNPVNHKGSMQFNEIGRVAIINPFVLMHMFTNDNWDHHGEYSHGNLPQVRNSYIKKAVAIRLEKEFGPEVLAAFGIQEIGIRERGIAGLVATAWALARSTTLALQETINLSERAKFKFTIVMTRRLLQKIFACATADTKSFKGYTNIPNIHLALHYSEDIENYATARNSCVMMGEQKHKIFKAHATHINSKDSVMQLMRATNTSQTIRFILDGAFKTSSPAISRQVIDVVNRCPTLQKRFLGAKLHDKEELDEEPNSCTGIECSNSLMVNPRTGRHLPRKSISSADILHDAGALRSVYRSEYDTEIHSNTPLKVNYWGYFAGDIQDTSKPKGPRFSIGVGGFLRFQDEPFSFHCVSRIFTVTIGTMVRVFFVLDVVERDPDQETGISPYRVFRLPTDAATRIVGIRKIDPTILHFVSKCGGTWWFNPYVPHFL